MKETFINFSRGLDSANTLLKYIEAHHNKLDEEVLQSVNENVTSTYTSDASSNSSANKGGVASCERPLGVSPSVIKMMVVFGELGGRDDSLVEALKEGKVHKPVVAWVCGTCARLFKSEVQFGHAGAKSGGELESAPAKNQALREAGAVVPTSFEALESAIKETYN